MRKSVSSIVAILLILFAQPVFAATSIKSGSTCPKIGKVQSVGMTKFKCTRVNSKLVWKKQANATNYGYPMVKPTFATQYEAGKITIKLNLVSQQFAKENYVKKVSSVIYAKQNGVTKVIGEGNFDYSTWNEKDGKTLTFSLTLKEEFMSAQISVDSAFLNEFGPGEKTSQLVDIRVAAPTPSATPSPTPTATPTPSATPTITPTNTPEVGCNVNYLSALPFASQRIVITSISWEKDSLGYVSAIASMRNDNPMSLRLVEFSFSAVHKYAVVHFDQTLQGNSFFIKDDPKFNSLEGQSGSWLSGQTRTFRLPSNQMLECRSISVLSSGFSVAQGIGE